MALVIEHHPFHRLVEDDHARLFHVAAVTGLAGLGVGGGKGVLAVVAGAAVHARVHGGVVQVALGLGRPALALEQIGMAAVAGKAGGDHVAFVAEHGLDRLHVDDLGITEGLVLLGRLRLGCGHRFPGGRRGLGPAVRGKQYAGSHEQTNCRQDNQFSLHALLSLHRSGV